VVYRLTHNFVGIFIGKEKNNIRNILLVERILESFEKGCIAFFLN
jgi:hypothetical protein